MRELQRNESRQDKLVDNIVILGSENALDCPVTIRAKITMHESRQHKKLGQISYALAKGIQTPKSASPSMAQSIKEGWHYRLTTCPRFAL